MVPGSRDPEWTKHTPLLRNSSSAACCPGVAGARLKLVFHVGCAPEDTVCGVPSKSEASSTRGSPSPDYLKLTVGARERSSFCCSFTGTALMRTANKSSCLLWGTEATTAVACLVPSGRGSLTLSLDPCGLSYSSSLLLGQISIPIRIPIILVRVHIDPWPDAMLKSTEGQGFLLWVYGGE